MNVDEALKCFDWQIKHHKDAFEAGDKASEVRLMLSEHWKQEIILYSTAKTDTEEYLKKCLLIRADTMGAFWNQIRVFLDHGRATEHNYSQYLRKNVCYGCVDYIHSGYHCVVQVSRKHFSSELHRRTKS